MHPACLAVAGLAAAGALLAVYGRYQSPEMLTPAAVGDLQRMAYWFYPALAVALGAVGWGLRGAGARLAAGPPGGRLRAVAAAARGRRPGAVFAAVFVGYGAFFSLASGTLVYQPEVEFSRHYGVEVPSAEVAPCCGPPGYMPKALVYLTEHVGLQFIPANLLLQAAVSYLVGLNAAVAASAYSAPRGRRGMGGLGAATGLFIACPTCAGSLAAAVAGTATGLAAAAALAQVQTLLIAVSIPVLLATPLMMAPWLPGGACGAPRGGT